MRYDYEQVPKYVSGTDQPEEDKVKITNIIAEENGYNEPKVTVIFNKVINPLSLENVEMTGLNGKPRFDKTWEGGGLTASNTLYITIGNKVPIPQGEHTLILTINGERVTGNFTADRDLG